MKLGYEIIKKMSTDVTIDIDKNINKLFIKTQVERIFCLHNSGIFFLV
jgi:hypothetical protein